MVIEKQDKLAPETVKAKANLEKELRLMVTVDIALVLYQGQFTRSS